MTKEEVSKFYEEFQPPKGFIVPEKFPVMRFKSVMVKKQDRTEEVMKSGIVLPHTAKTDRFVGRVYAVGPETTNLKPGMKVIFNGLANQTLLVDSIEYLFMHDTDVYAIIPEDVITFEEHKEREGRKQYSYDEMPDVAPSKEEVQLDQEIAKEMADKIKQEHSKKHYGVDGIKSEN